MSLSRFTYAYSLDWVRAIAIVSVVMVHSIRFGLVPSHRIWGSLLQLVFQFGRVAFMIVTGFIIAFQYRDRTPRWLYFFGRRTKSVGAPYFIWLMVFLAVSVPVWPVLPYLGHLRKVVFTGNGHLYYMIVTFQMYLLAPTLLWVLKFARRQLAWLGGLAVTWEVGSWTMAGYAHHNGWAPPLLVITYVGYFVLGGTLGYAWPTVRQWLKSHRRFASYSLVPLLGLLTATFFADLQRFGLGTAVSVFQPMSAIYCVAITFLLLAAGTWYVERRSAVPRLAGIISRIADASLGIYLVHPLFVHGWLDLMSWQGISINPYINTVMAWACGVAFSLALVSLFRRLPFSEYVIGTKRQTSPRLADATNAAPDSRPATVSS